MQRSWPLNTPRRTAATDAVAKLMYMVAGFKDYLIYEYMDSKKLYIVSLIHQDRYHTENNDIFILGGFLEKKKAEKFIKKFLAEIGDPGEDTLAGNIDELDLTEILTHGSQIFDDLPAYDDEIIEEIYDEEEEDEEEEGNEEGNDKKHP